MVPLGMAGGGVVMPAPDRPAARPPEPAPRRWPRNVVLLLANVAEAAMRASEEPALHLVQPGQEAEQ